MAKKSGQVATAWSLFFLARISFGRAAFSFGESLYEGTTISVSFYPANLITAASQITATSQWPAQLSEQVEPHKGGTADVIIRGVYTGTIDRYYRVQITDPVQQLYIWSDDAGVTWSAPQQALGLGQGGAADWVTLSFGVQFMFVAGPMEPQLKLADAWWFKAIRKFGVANLLDPDRDKECRTGALPAGGGFAWEVDFGTARTVHSVILFDHNIPSGSNVIINASTSSTFSPLNINQTIPWAANKLLYVVTGTSSYRYWRIVVNNLPVAVPYIRASYLRFGDVYLLSNEFRIGYVPSERVIGQSPESRLIRGLGSFGFRPKHYELEFPTLKTSVAGDLLMLRSIWALVWDEATLTQRPFFVYFDSVQGLEIFELLHWIGDYREPHTIVDLVDVPVELLGLVRTAA